MEDTRSKVMADAFQRRCNEAALGRHLPSVNDLLRLSPFLNNDVESDIQEFAERAARQIKSQSEAAIRLRQALETLTVAPWREVVEETLSALLAADSKTLNPKAAKSYTDRFRIYAASLGNHGEAVNVALMAFGRAVRSRDKSTSVDYLRSAIGWLTFVHFAQSNSLPGSSFGSQYYLLRRNGDDMLEPVAAHYRELRERESCQKPEEPASLPKQSPPAECTAPPGTLVVVTEIANPNISKGADVAKEFAGILNRPLPLHSAANIDDARRAMRAEFPYATAVVERLFAEIARYPYVRLRPTVLVGTPGSGKTRFCQRLVQLLGLPSTVFSCGGVADGTVSGTSRHWHSAQPSLPLGLIRQHEVANPAVILDELEKAGDSRYNGNLHDALLGFLEPHSAAAWRDPYIEHAVNLSGVVWLATANSLQGCSAPLRDRLQAIRFPDPGIEHLEPLARSLLDEIAAECGQHSAWALPLTGEELDALRARWSGGSVRQLRRYLEGILAVRDAEMVSN
jgi:hypothetical protein